MHHDKNSFSIKNNFFIEILLIILTKFNNILLVIIKFIIYILAKTIKYFYAF